MIPRRIPPKSGLGYTLRAASQETGLTVWQLRKLVADGRVRSARPHKYVTIHPQDVKALADTAWQGQAWTPPAAQ